MRYLLASIFVLGATSLFAQLPPPPPMNIKFEVPETQVKPTPLPTVPFQNTIQPMGGYQGSGSVRAGDTTRVKNSTVVYSAPQDSAYRCALLNAGETVTILQLPEPGSSFTTIACPENCYLLIPFEYIYSGLFNRNPPKNYTKEPHRVQGTIVPLIDGEPADGKYLPSKTPLMNNAMVRVFDEKNITINGKVKKYCRILTSHKDIRYVRTADLEGVQDVARQPSRTDTFPNSSSPLYNQTSPPNNIWIPNEPVQQSAYPQEQLPAQWLSLIQTADQAYRYGLQSGVWEDARQRYMQLLDSDISSIRIIAKNRLEFIREWQQSPPVQTVARNSTYYPPPNTTPWLPSELAARLPRQPAMTASQPSHVPETTVRPTSTPVANTRPQSPLDIPLPPGHGMPQQQIITPQPGNVSTAQPAPRQPQQPVPTSVPQSQRVTVVGKINKTTEYTGSNPLFYLTDSQGMLTYHARGSQLIRYEQQRVRLEGLLYRVPVHGVLKNVITVEKVEPLR